jgi:hypothetical protein
MKSIFIIFSILLFSTLNSSAKSTYGGHYVSIPHLHKIFNQVKKNSDVNKQALANTFTYYERNRYKKDLSPNYMAIADYTKVAMHKRLYIINLHSGRVYTHLVAHGKNSGAKGGRVWRSSNKLGSHMTPFGFFKIGSKEGITTKKRYDYLSVEGLEQKNKNAKKRDILLHTANYVNWAGKSYGCFAIKPQDKYQVFSKLKKALLYSYTGR